MKDKVRKRHIRNSLRTYVFHIKIEEKDGVYTWKAILTNTSGEKFNFKKELE